MGFLKRALLTILTIAYYHLASTKIAAQESIDFVPAPSPMPEMEPIVGMDVGAGFELIMSWPLLWACLLLFSILLSENMFANMNIPDTSAIDSEQHNNMFADIVSNIYSDEPLIPIEMSHYEDSQPLADIGALSSADNDWQHYIESTEEDDDNYAAVGYHVIDVNNLGLPDSGENLDTMDHGLNLAHHQERVEEDDGAGKYTAIDLDSNELMDIHVIRHTEYNDLHAESRGEIDLAHEDQRVVTSPDSEVIKHMGSDGIRHSTVHNCHSEPNLAHDYQGVDEQMHSVHNVNETSTRVDVQNCSRRDKRKMETEKESSGLTLSKIEQQFGKSLEDAAECSGVSRSTFKRYCRVNGINRWSRKLKVQPRAASSSLIGLATTAPLLSTPTVETMATFQFDNNTTMSIKVSYNGEHVKFPLTLSSGIKDLEAEVVKRFVEIERGSFSIKYEDEENDWISVKCDVDLHHAMHILKSKGITTMKLMVIVR